MGLTHVIYLPVPIVRVSVLVQVYTHYLESITSAALAAADLAFSPVPVFPSVRPGPPTVGGDLDVAGA